MSVSLRPKSWAVLAFAAAVGLVVGCADAPPSTASGDPPTDSSVDDQSDVGADLPDYADLAEEDADIPEEDLVPGPLRVTGGIVAGGGRASGERYSLRAHVSVPPQPSESVGSRFRLVTGGSAAGEGHP